MPHITTKGGLANITADILLSRRDPQAAREFLLNHYPSYEEAAIATRVYGMWKTVRRILLKDPRSVSPAYEYGLLAVRGALEEEGNLDDVAKIDLLIGGEMGLRVKVSDTKAQYLDDEELDDYIKTIDPLDQIISDFRLPVSIVTLAITKEKERAVEARHHNRKARESYTVTRDELDSIHAKAKMILDEVHVITNEKDYWDLVFAVGVVSGRRIFEILSKLAYRQGPGDYQAYVTGIAKKQWQIAMNIGQEIEYPIPLTVPYVLFEKGMNLIRGHRSYEGMDCSQVSKATSTKEQTASNRCVGKVLTHTQKRNLYLEKAFRDREVNRFYVGEDSCSKTQWYINALCHNDVSTSPIERYSNINITD